MDWNDIEAKWKAKTKRMTGGAAVTAAKKWPANIPTIPAMTRAVPVRLPWWQAKLQ